MFTTGSSLPIPPNFSPRQTTTAKLSTTDNFENGNRRCAGLNVKHIVLAAALGSLSVSALAGDRADSANVNAATGEDDGVALTITTRETESRVELDRLFDEAASTSSSFADSASANDWLRDMSDRIAFKIKDPVYRVELLSLVHKHARAVGLDPQIVLSVIEVESMFNRFAVSKSGARGLMQIMPFWVKEIGHPRDNLFHPETNLWYGCYILRHYLDRSKGDLGMALRRYNGGGDDRYSNKVLSALQKRWLVAR